MASIQLRRPATANDSVLVMRPLQHERAVEQVHLRVAVQPVGARPARVDVDDPAQAEPMVGLISAGDEREPVDHLAVHGRAEAAEVVEHRHVHAVDVDAGVGGRRAPDRQETDPERRARDAWEVLDGLQRVALGAGDALDLRGGERLLDRLDDGALPAHGRRVPLLHVDEQAELGRLPFVQRDRDVDGENRRAAQRQLVLAHGERGERKSSLLVA